MALQATVTSTRTGDRWARDSGFSLVELLVVVIIVGILAGIAIPMYLNQRKKAVDASLKSDLKNAGLIGTQIVDDGPYAAYAPFNPGSWSPSWQPPESEWAGWDHRSIWTKYGFKPTGSQSSPGADWTGNRVLVGGEPRAGRWQLCAWNPGASSATDRSRALGYDESRGGLVTQLDCTPGAGVFNWVTLTPWFDGNSNPLTSW